MKKHKCDCHLYYHQVCNICQKSNGKSKDKKYMNPKEAKLKHELDYIEFLERRLNSNNFKKNATPEEYSKTEAKLKKAKLVLKILK